MNVFRRRGKERDKGVKLEENGPKKDLWVYESRKKLVASKEREREALGKEIAELPGGSGRMEEGEWESCHARW